MEWPIKNHDGSFKTTPTAVEVWVESMKVYGLDDCTKPMIYFMQPGSIEVDGNHAKAVAYTIEIYDQPGTNKRIHGTGRYEDELEKRDGKWLFTRRSYRVLHEDISEI